MVSTVLNYLVKIIEFIFTYSSGEKAVWEDVVNQV